MNGGPARADGADEPTACGETLAVVRKKALLRILARREAARGGLAVTQAAVEAEAALFRAAAGLHDDAALAGWLDTAGLSGAAFATAMHDFALVRLLEDRLAREIDGLVSDQIAVSTARLRAAPA
ncbi:hypothetical protein [Methylobacterium oryzisoli]|uniref:hypothetical protein n=1 Tax=Methylobacterium oryzisoli TaxID=3385502 RepID=UPI0038925831